MTSRPQNPPGLERRVTLQPAGCGRRPTYSFGFVVVVLGLLGCACGTKPADWSRPAAGSAPAVTGQAEVGRALVVGKGPKAKWGGAIVVLEPRAAREFPAPTEPRVMDQFGLGFSPELLLVQQDQPVEFRNSEDVLHNVRVINADTREPEFNVSPPHSASYTHVFKRSGYYAVSCDIHPAMAANILVTSTPHAVVAGADGSFVFADVAPGSYTIKAYHFGETIERIVEIAAPRTELVLEDR